ncbi:MAG: class I SAM-dependent RNA methyltransferase [Myxococcota bacterium]
MHNFVLTTSRDREPALIAELAMHGLTGHATHRGAVRLRGSLEDGYRCCLWSRIAGRVLMPIGVVDASSADALYESTKRGPWSQHLSPDRTFAINVVGTNPVLRHPHFTAVRIKDAIVDQFRDKVGSRPSIDREQPDLRFHVLVDGRDAHISLDLSGDPLHRRGLGRDGGPAPLRETLAAAILMTMQWPRLATEGVPLVDPMCGSGTFLREAAGYALDMAPGIHRDHWGFLRWPQHDANAWQRLLDEAEGRIRPTLDVPIIGSDIDPNQVARAQYNLAQAGLDEAVEVIEADFSDLEVGVEGPGEPRGVLVMNPPYGERLGEQEDVEDLYAAIGDRLRQHWLGWTAFVLAGSKPLAAKLHLKSKQKTPLMNAQIDARLIELPISTTPVNPKP